MISSSSVENHEWFDHLIADYNELARGSESVGVSVSLLDWYRDYTSEHLAKWIENNQQAAQKHFITNMLYDYLKLIMGLDIQQLAFGYQAFQLLVWAEISDDREDLEAKLIMAEAKVNAKYHDLNATVQSMIVEVGDGLAIPNTYKPVDYRSNL